MGRLVSSVPDSRRLFRRVDVFTSCENPVLIACNRRRRKVRWLLLVALLAGLWGIGIAGQFAGDSVHTVSGYSDVEFAGGRS